MRAEGFTRQEITFSGSVNIQQIGHAVLHLDEYDEDYLVPLPNVKVKGILTGGPYPELNGSYSIVASSGYIAEIDFSGKGMLGIGGKKNAIHAAMYSTSDKSRKEPIFTAEGSWSESFTLKDRNGKDIDHYDMSSARSSECRTAPLSQQDPWESRKAWQGVINALDTRNMQGVANHKSELENAQRALRKRPETSEDSWEPVFFRKDSSEPVASRLMALVGQELDADATCGVWRFDLEKAATLEKPWRGKLTPFGSQA